MYENKLSDHKEKNLKIFYQILSSNSGRKCMEISMEDFYVDTGA